MDYDINGRSVFPLSDLISIEQFSLAPFVPSGTAPALLDTLRYTESWSSWDGYNQRITAVLVLENELALAIPGWGGATLVVGSPSKPTPVLAEFVIGADHATMLSDVTLHARFDPHLLRDVATGGPAQVDAAASLESSPAFGHAVSIACGDPGGACPRLAPAYLSDTKLVVSSPVVRFAFGPTPDVGLADVESRFQGFVFDHLDVLLPGVDATPVRLENCYVGTAVPENSVRSASHEVQRAEPLSLDGRGELVLHTGPKRTHLGLHCTGFAPPANATVKRTKDVAP